MTPMQILNRLYAGDKITLSFTDEIQREQFRQQLYKVKKTQDAAVTAVLDEEKLVLRAKKYAVQIGLDTHFRIDLWMEEKSKPSYEVISIEPKEGDHGRSTKEVSGSVVKDSKQGSDG